MAHSTAIKYFEKRRLKNARKRLEGLKKENNKTHEILQEIKDVEEEIDYLLDSLYRKGSS